MPTQTAAVQQPIQLPLPELQMLLEERQRLRDGLYSPYTLKNYAGDWKRFQSWCAAMGRCSLPASTDTVGLYITGLIKAGLKITTAKRHSSAISFYHRREKHATPVTQDTWDLFSGAQRIKQESPDQKAALTADIIVRMCKHLASSDPAAVRDRCILLFGYASALRRGNLIALNVEDVTQHDRGLLIRLGREKQERRGVGRTIAITRGKHPSTCPVRAMEKWLEVRGTDPGPLFLSVAGEQAQGCRFGPHRISLMIKRTIKGIGLDPADFSVHSLRAGFVTELMDRGVGELRISAQTGHRSLQSLRRYHRPTDPFRGNACLDLGL